ncbi:MAG: hypothetical protein NWS44_00030 [Candidatus Nanopelagicales bacterium]|jgi:hypothetical protein|nr:hypothetical protein [Candidatus Nanopelagicales bacterium]MDP4746598.1 hypothetical protein [Candidatus Nanopelagicales bacterium]
MATLLVKDVPDELYIAFVNYAAKKGLTLEEAVNKAIEKYIEKAEFEDLIQKSLKRKISAEVIVDAIHSERNRNR